MPKYIGITIGPIYKTLMKAKKTRELFAASYIFSYIMKNIIKNDAFKNKPFIIPYFDKNELDAKFGIGIFPDRMIFEVSEGDFDQLQEVIESILKDISSEILLHMRRRLKEHLPIHKANIEDKHTIYNALDVKEISNYLSNYFKIYYCKIENENDYTDINKTVNSYLDSLELQEKFIQEETCDYLADFFYYVNHSFIMKDAFDKKLSFPSIPEIAMHELNLPKSFLNFDDDTKIYDNVGREFKDFKHYHKYIAIICADADSMGKTIESLQLSEDFLHLSSVLYEFAKKANEKIKENGGVTIYAGGDDLFFFAPIVSKNKNVIHLIHDLKEIFKDLIEEKLGKRKVKPTLSFGLSISYYKYPMNEALEISNSLLYLAKSMKERRDSEPDKKKKNSLAFKVLKHSGKSYGGCFCFDSQEYSNIKKILCGTKAVNLPEKTINSLIYKLSLHKTMLMNIGSNKTKLENFFKNNFNEEIHADTEQYISKISNFTYEMMVSKYYDKNNKKNDLRIEYICSVLRLLNFLQGGN